MRALYKAYAGPLYQVRRGSDNTTMDIKVTAAGGFADSAAQDKFCGASACHIWRIYDQSAKMNHLDIAPPGGAHRAEDVPVNATKESLVLIFPFPPVFMCLSDDGMLANGADRRRPQGLRGVLRAFTGDPAGACDV